MGGDMRKCECKHELRTMSVLSNFRGDIVAVLMICKKCGRVVRENFQW